MDHIEQKNSSKNNVRKMLDLSGKVAIVTGASYGGIGYYSAEGLAEAGASVAVSDVNSNSRGLQKTLENLEKLGVETMGFEMDVSDQNSVIAGIEKVHERFSKIDILLNNAGVMLRKPALDMSIEEWDRIIRINLTGSWLVDREVARLMIKNGNSEGRRIINVSSGYATMVGALPESAYVASKAGVANLTRDLAMEWAKYGINVNCIAPGVFYPTRMTEPLSQDPGRLEIMSRRSIKGRLGNPERDLKGIVVFLASEASEYVTAQLIFVDGGWNAW